MAKWASPHQTTSSWQQRRVNDLPLYEFDPSPGLITPSAPALAEPLPARVVLSYFPELVSALPATHGAGQIGWFSGETGAGDIYAVGSGNDAVAVTHAGMGAPLAAHHLEQLIAAGGTTFVACAGAGAV